VFAYSEMTDDDDDQKLIPKLVEKLAVPVLIEAIEYDWDPLSYAHQKPCIAIVKDALAHIDPECKAVQELCGSIMQRLERTLANHITLPRVPMSSREVATYGINDRQVADTRWNGQWSWCMRWWYRAVKLYSHVTSWRSVLKDESIRELSWTHMNDSILPFLLRCVEYVIDIRHQRAPPDVITEAELLRMCARLLSIIPSSWSTTGAGSSGMISSLSLIIAQLYGLLTELIRTIPSSISSLRRPSLTRFRCVRFG
jgi:hypothetical protein